MTKLYRLQPQIKTEHNNPVLTKRDGIEYRYRLIKKQLRIRSKMEEQYTGVAEEDLPLPYGFIIGTLKHYVHYIDANQTPSCQGYSEKILLLAQSPKKGFAVALLVSMQDYKLTVYDIQTVDGEMFFLKDVNLYPEVEHYYFDTLNLDVYMKEIKEKIKIYESRRRKKILNKTTIFYERKGYEYRYKMSQHINTKRSPSKGVRLTLPVEAVEDIMKFLIVNEKSNKELTRQLKDVKDEKQIALIFYNRDRTHFIGLLVAINIQFEDVMIVNVITMYDDIPKDRSAQKLLFLKVERIALYDYELELYMSAYDQKQKKKKKRKEEQLKRRLFETNIKQVSSVDEHNKYTRHIKKGKVSSGIHRKIKKVQIEKPYSSIEPSVTHKLQTSNTAKGNVIKTFLNWVCKSYAKLQFHYSRLTNHT